MPEKPWLQLAVPDAPDPLDPGGESLADVNGQQDDDPEDEVPFFVVSEADHERWTECEQLAEKMTDSDVELSPFIARELFLSDIPTNETDVNRQAPNLSEPASAEVPSGVED